MPSAEPSYTLKGVLGLLPALKAPDGTKYPWTPCMDTPYAWDEDATVGVRRNAARQCLEVCPALAACASNLALLTDPDDETSKQARGVWAGRILTRRGEIPVEPASTERAPEPAVNRRRRAVSSPVTEPMPDSMTIVTGG